MNTAPSPGQGRGRCRFGGEGMSNKEGEESLGFFVSSTVGPWLKRNILTAFDLSRDDQ